MNLNPQLVKLEISNLLLSYPDLADDEQLRADMIEGATGTFEFLSAVVRRMDETHALETGLDIHIIEMQTRASRLKRRHEALRSLIFKLMQKADLAKAELPEATLSIRKGTPQLIGDCDPNLLPDCFRRVKIEVDRTAIKETLKNGIPVDGFTLSNAEPVLSIRRT